MDMKRILPSYSMTVYPDVASAPFGQSGKILEIEVGESLDNRIAVIKRLIEIDLRDPEMHRVAYGVTQPCPWRDSRCELQTIFDYITETICSYNPYHKREVCQTRVRYTGESLEHDTYRRSLRTLELGGADCDDVTQVVAVLAKLNGFAVKARVTSNTGETWDHIYPLAGLPKGPEPTRWLALDTTLGPNRFGDHPPQARKHREFIL